MVYFFLYEYKRELYRKGDPGFSERDYSEDTKTRVQHWLLEEEHKEEKEKALFDCWERHGPVVSRDSEQALNQLKAQLGIREKKNHSSLFTFYFSLSGTYRMIAAVLLLVLLLGGGIFYLYAPDDRLEVTTGYGEMKKVDLPDGSQVWLNAGSSLSYQTSKGKEQRQVDLSGEAFFVVEKASEQPFVVRTGRLEVQVLGTEFNVEDYPEDSRAMVTLQKGKVQIGIADSVTEPDFYYPEPGQQLIYDPRQSVAIVEVPPTEPGRWREGQLVFPSSPLKDIIRTLERHFDIRIRVYDLTNEQDEYAVRFIHGEDLQQIMQVLQGLGGDFSYEMLE